MKEHKLLITVIAFIFLFGIGLGRASADRNITVQEGLRVNCTYPYGKDGFLTNDCYALINMALRNGYKVSHDTVRPDGSVTFIVR